MVRVLFLMIVAGAMTGLLQISPAAAINKDIGEVAFQIVPPPPPSIIYYDGFESGIGPQYLSGGNIYAASVPSAIPHTGRSAVVSDPGLAGTGWLEYDFMNTRAGVLTISFWDNMAGCHLGGMVRQYVNVLNTQAYPFSVRGVGPDTLASACNYAYRVDDNNIPSIVPRTPGWHQFTLTWIRGNLTTSIDGIVVYKEDSYFYEPNETFFGNVWGNSDRGVWDDLVIGGLS